MEKHSSRYLLVKHSTGWNVDRCCAWMEQNQLAYDWCYPGDGQSFPDVSDYDGVIIYGGSCSANDCGSVDWVKAELAFIETVLTADTPFFGICLGAQMMARVLGSEVRKHPTDMKEVGFHPIYPTENSGNFLDAPLHVMQWHSEGFELPIDCERIARGEVFPNQAFRYRENVYGVQFHPEVNPAVLAIWQERNKLRSPGQIDDATRAQQTREALAYDQEITTWLDGFLQRWVA